MALFFKTSMSFQISMIMAMSLVFVSCAKEKQLKNEVKPEAYISKADMTGLKHLVRGIVEADSDNDIDAIPGMHIDVGIVQPVITKDELQFVAIVSGGMRKETPRVVAAYPILQHFDIKRETNDFGEETNKVIEDSEKPWNERRYMRVDWAKPTAAFAVTNQLYSEWIMNEQNIVLTEDFKNSNGHITFETESSISQQNLGMAASGVLGWRVRMKTHLLPVKESDFKAIEYSDADFTRFGYFRTQENFEDPEKGLLDSTIKKYANVFNVCEPGRAESCSTNKIVYVLSQNFPQVYKDLAQNAVEEWNQAFKKALGRTDDVVVLDLTRDGDISDPSVNMIAYYDPKSGGGLLGVSQTVNNPLTGETVAARATIYGDGIRYTVGMVDDILDMVLQVQNENKSLSISQALTRAFATDVLADASLLKQKIQLREKDLKLNRGGLHPDQKAGSVKGAVASARQSSTGTRDQATSKRKTVLASRPDLFAIPDITRSGLSFTIDGVSKERSLSKVNGLDNLLLPGQSDDFKLVKNRELRRGALNIHGEDLVEEAALRYILNFIKSHPELTDIESVRKGLKTEVARFTFYTTALHEMGHNFGLRHNFQASADKPHYHPRYFELKEKGADKSDRAPFTYSSVMDYASDFYDVAGGLGPYDAAAIRFAYNRSIDKTKDAMTSPKEPFKFCTDHQVGESPLCRRFDKGSNVSEITANAIDTYKRNYIRTHFRRGRARFNVATSGVPGYILFNTMFPVRQAIDELIYQLIKSPSLPAAANQCESQIMRESIETYKEMANICNNLQAEREGVDTLDISTWVKGLLDPETGHFRVAPEDLQPAGFADLLLASELANEFFIDVLGAPEAGHYLLEKTADGDAQMTLLPKAASIDDALKALAQERDVESDKIDEFVKTQKDFVTEIEKGTVGKVFTSEYDESQSDVKDLSIGYEIDKILALITLGARDLGVEKYIRMSMSGNAYLFPHTKKIATGLMSAMVTDNKLIARIPVTLANGQTFTPLVPATTSETTSRYAILTSLLDFVSDQNTEFLDKMRICTVDSKACDGKDGLQTVTLQSAGTNVYKASQTYYNDGIAFDLLQGSQELIDARKKNSKLIAEGEQTLKKSEEELKAKDTVALIERLSALASGREDLKFINTIVDTSGKTQSVVAIANILISNFSEIGTFETLNAVGSMQARMESVEQKLDELAAKAKGKQDADIVSAKKDSKLLHGQLKKVLNDIRDLKIAPILVEQATSSIAQKESVIKSVRDIIRAVGFE